ncbi:MAG: hypothetical protein ACLFPE_04110 [Bacteroidales bacterium]
MPLFSFPAGEAAEEIPENVEGNQLCMKCHGQDFYYYYNDWLERDVRERMNPYYVIDSAEFYQSNHNTFYCTDCHSSEYETFPHEGYLRMEPSYTCMDCHGGDENWAHFNFEKIEAEYEKSVHASRHNEDFTCWMCHDPHTYRISVRETKNIRNTIAYTNGICLECHADVDIYQLLTEEENPNILKTHDWLPNQELHFASVRCIECHTRISDSLLVAHQIVPKDQAVKRCVECHSSNSLLMASLYKHQTQEQRGKKGFLNAAILNEAYVIGANRSPLLNNISLIVFGLVLLAIVAHAILRIIKS